MDSNTNNQTTQSQNQDPGLVAGHAEYIKGVAEVCNSRLSYRAMVILLPRTCVLHDELTLFGPTNRAPSAP